MDNANTTETTNPAKFSMGCMADWGPNAVYVRAVYAQTATVDNNGRIIRAVPLRHMTHSPFCGCGRR